MLKKNRRFGTGERPLEDTQVGYILPKYTWNKYTLEEYTLEKFQNLGKISDFWKYLNPDTHTVNGYILGVYTGNKSSCTCIAGRER